MRKRQPCTPSAHRRWAVLALLMLALPVAALPVAAQPVGPPPFRHISGLEIMRLDAHRLYVARGAAADNAARTFIEVARPLTVDIRQIGALGRDDVATPADVAQPGAALEPDAAMPNGFRARYAADHPLAGRPLRGWYYPVYLGTDTATPRRADGSAMLTRQLSSMRDDRPGDARAPEPFTTRRHAPMAFFYDPQAGFRPMTCQGWPQPACLWTNGGTRSAYALIENATATTWERVSAADWLPDSGRILRLQAVLRSVDGVGGAWAKPLAHRPDALLLGWVNRPGDVDVAFFELATTSREEFVYRVDPGVTLSIYAIGFALLQPF
jgi:hypothetical protein